MPFMMVRNRVQDFDHWKSVFDEQGARNGEAGLRLRGLWRGVEDPGTVYFLLEVDDIERAKAYLFDPQSARVGEAAGVIDGEFHFVDEVS